MHLYRLNGQNVTDLKSFFNEFAKAVNAPNNYFGKCLQSFDDCLFGGFGLEFPCKLIWLDSSFSKQNLDSAMLVEYYEQLLENNDYIHDDNFAAGKQEVLNIICKAKKGEISMFDVIVESISTVNQRATWDLQLQLVLE